MVTWREFAGDECEIVYSSLSILAEPLGGVADKIIEQKGTRTVAQAYLKFLSTQDGQRIVSVNLYRPRDKSVPTGFVTCFPAPARLTAESPARCKQCSDSCGS